VQGFHTLQFLEKNKLRPLIRWTKEDVLKYAHFKKLQYIQDPSNKSNLYFRNWIRNKWLMDLEKRQKGAMRTFKNSLLKVRDDLLSHHQHDWGRFLTSSGIERNSFLFLNKAEQRAILATYLRSMNVENYKTTHIDEILKRLDSSQKNITFELLKCIWTIDTKHISAKKKSGLA
jgi:tRNA(Ile)-lysidine synthase TilS/MesJ